MTVRSIVVALAALACLSTQAEAQTAGQGSGQRALLDKYCVTCHNQRLKTAGLMLDTADVDHAGADSELWEKVIRKVRAGMMPPARMPRPDRSTLERFVNSLEGSLDQAVAAKPDPGHTSTHRLNRAEYANAIRDLFGLDIDARALLPADDSAYGFDNIGDLQTVSPAALERYLSAARRISRLVVGDPTLPPVVSTYKMSKVMLQDERNAALPFGTRGGAAVDHHFPLDGEYVIRVDVQRGYYSEHRGRDVPNVIDVRIDGESIGRFSIPPDSPQNVCRTGNCPDSSIQASLGLERRVRVKAGTRRVGAALLNARWFMEGFGPSRQPVGSTTFGQNYKTSVENGKIEMGVDHLQIEGPFNGTVPTNTESRKRLFVCMPQSQTAEDACASRIVSALARRAFRRTVRRDESQRLLVAYREARKDGTFDSGVQAIVERVLTHPSFLFRIEATPAGVQPGAVYKISDVDLASRLSFFLWSSIPDETLLTLAERGRLRNPTVVEQQVRRMLADAKASAFRENFFGQWLFLRNVGNSKPDLHAFPEFEENLRDGFRLETDFFLQAQLLEDRPATELFTANYTFVNERLARYYGLSNVFGERFRRVSYPDNRRAGILGHASILMVSSYPNRTSPVLRGKYLLTNILGTPPPPPPPDVPPLDENHSTERARSVRERMELHRTNPVCSNCHSMLDPLGFAFENFDAIGQWRTVDTNVPIDASGAFPDGSKFAGPAEFRSALLQYRQQILTTLTEKLLTYALGRGVTAVDMPAIRAVLRESATQDYRWSALIVGIARSTPFQMRRAES